MNAANRLREEIRQQFPFTKKEFIDEISDRIRKHGRATYICDKHIYETTRSMIALRDEQIAKDFAISESFSWHYDYNSYGVRHIIFTL